MATKALSTYRLIDQPSTRSRLFRDTTYFGLKALRKDLYYEVSPGGSRGKGSADRRTFNFVQQFEHEFVTDGDISITAKRRGQVNIDMRFAFGAIVPSADRLAAINNCIALLESRKQWLIDGLLEDSQFEA